MSQFHDLDPRFIVQVLQFLVTIYNLRRGRSKSSPNDKDRESVPDPDKLKELIKEVESERSDKGIATAIDEKFSPSEAKQVKDDFTVFAILGNPPNFSDYNFFGLVQRYVESMQTIALTADLFRLRGSKMGGGIRILGMPETSAALVPEAQRNSAVYAEGDFVSASVAKCVALLTDKRVECPLVIVLEGVFHHVSRLGDSGLEKAERAYMLKRGQESNWLAFDFAFKEPARFVTFQPFEYRLNATDVKTIFAALKTDITSYLGDVEQERPVLQELRQELDGLSNVIVPKAKT